MLANVSNYSLDILPKPHELKSVRPRTVLVFFDDTARGTGDTLNPRRPQKAHEPVY